MTDVFKITQVGLDASTDAALHGISVTLATFKVGSAYGYNPTKLDTALHGSVLYTDNITSFSTDSQGNLIINCTMSAAAGPFLFGEIGIYTDTNVLFALMALPDLQHKYTSLGSNVASTFTLQGYLRLGQAGGIINIVTGGGGGGGTTFDYIAQAGQPTGLWGTNDGGLSYVWNPSNFNVATATSSHGVSTSGAAVYAATGHTFTNTSATTLATLDGSGNFTATGQLTAYSDKRLKEDVTSIDNVIDRLLSLSGVTYRRIGHEKREMGLLAQDVQLKNPEAVIQDENGMLSVGYGNLAAALLVEGFKHLWSKSEAQHEEIVALRAAIRQSGARY